MSGSWQYISLHKSNKSSSKLCGLINQTLTGMPCLRETCLDSKCYQNALMTLKADWSQSKATCRNGLIPYLVMWFMAVFPGKEWRLLSWKMTRKEAQDTFGQLRDLRTWSKPTDISGKAWWQLQLGLSTLRGRLLTKGQSKDSLWKFQQNKFEKACDRFDELLFLFMQIISLDTACLKMRVILGRKIMF